MTTALDRSSTLDLLAHKNMYSDFLPLFGAKSEQIFVLLQKLDVLLSSRYAFHDDSVPLPAGSSRTYIFKFFTKNELRRRRGQGIKGKV
jgi:hypothetical protein